jgi:hypothetical protein
MLALRRKEDNRTGQNLWRRSPRRLTRSLDPIPGRIQGYALKFSPSRLQRDSCEGEGREFGASATRSLSALSEVLADV